MKGGVPPFHPLNTILEVTPSPPPDNVNVKPCDVSHIQQLDGNMSVSSNESENSLIIPPPAACNTDRISSAVHLPTIATYNMRSIFPKIGNVKTDILERGISCGFFSEIWEKSEKKNHKFEIENMLESEGLKYISTGEELQL